MHGVWGVDGRCVHGESGIWGLEGDGKVLKILYVKSSCDGDNGVECESLSDGRLGDGGFGVVLNVT